MQNNNTGQVKKTKSKTTLLHKFVDKFTKKKKRSKGSSSTQTSRERSNELSKGKRVSRSASKAKVSSASKLDPCEVTAKGMRSKKETKETKEKKVVKEKKKVEEPPPPTPSRSPSTLALKTIESQMDMIVQSQKVEKGVKAWMEILEKCDFKKTFDNDFKPIDHFKVNPDKCQVFKKHLDMCQSDNAEVLDANRVKAGEGEFFYHGSVVTVPNVTAKVILAQLPLNDDPQCLEAFWLMVAANKMQRVFVLCGADEIDKKTFGEYFPDDFIEHKTIRVNNRKTAQKNEEQTNDMLYYEVVPKDCAEAPFAMMEICDFWPDGKIPTVPNRPASTAACVFESDIDADATIGVVSMFGAGRAGSFLVSALAIDRLRASEAPNIKDLATSVRTQRPGAIETLPQYTYIHVIALTYSLKHVTNQTLKGKIEKMIGQLETFAFEKLAEEDEEESTATIEN